jgi:hypothetical protein
MSVNRNRHTRRRQKVSDMHASPLRQVQNVRPVPGEIEKQVPVQDIGAGVNMAGCKEQHGNPYCSTSYPKIHIDVAHEIERIEMIRERLGTDRGWRRLQDSQDRIEAVRMGCAVGSRRLATAYRISLDSVATVGA